MHGCQHGRRMREEVAVVSARMAVRLIQDTHRLRCFQNVRLSTSNFKVVQLFISAHFRDT